MELLERTQQGHSSASSPHWESTNQVYEYICETSLNASAAPPTPRMGRRTRYAIASFLHDRPVSDLIPASIVRVSLLLLFFLRGSLTSLVQRLK